MIISRAHPGTFNIPASNSRGRGGFVTDFYISKKKMDDDRTRIIAVLVHPSINGIVYEGKRWSRSEVVASIKAGKTFRTVTRRDNGRWNVGDQVQVVKVHRLDFIKTATNNKEEDNLGELPDL